MRRIVAVDAARGFAVLLMIAYHFSFDLNYFGLIHQDLNHEVFWLASRSFIVSLFLFIAGISLVLASNMNASHFRTRQTRLFAAACAVSLASWLMFPESYIYFGILHFIFVASLIGRFFLDRPKIALISGLAVLVLGLTFSNAIFDRPYLQWIGFMTHKPYTEDYVPVFPWLGVVLIGIFSGNFLSNDAARFVKVAGGKWSRRLAFAGRHSLLVYLLHQPILLGILYLALKW